MSEKVLLVGDEEDFLTVLGKEICARDMKVSRALTVKDGLEKAGRENFAIIVLNLTVPGSDGLDTLKDLKSMNPEQEVFLLSRHVTAKKGIRAMKMGASALLDKSGEAHVLADKIVRSRAKKMLPVRNTKQSAK